MSSAHALGTVASRSLSLAAGLGSAGLARVRAASHMASPEIPGAAAAVDRERERAITVDNCRAAADLGAAHALSSALRAPSLGQSAKQRRGGRGTTKGAEDEGAVDANSGGAAQGIEELQRQLRALQAENEQLRTRLDVAEDALQDQTAEVL